MKQNSGSEASKLRQDLTIQGQSIREITEESSSTLDYVVVAKPLTPEEVNKNKNKIKSKNYATAAQTKSSGKKKDKMSKKPKRTRSVRENLAVNQSIAKSIEESKGEVDALDEKTGVLPGYDEVVPEEPKKYFALNEWSLKYNYGTKKFTYIKISPGKYRVNGIFKFEGSEIYIDQEMNVFDGVRIPVGATACGTLVAVDYPMNGSAPYNPTPTPETEEDRLWFCMESLIPSLDYRVKRDDMKLFRVAKSYYKRFYPDFVSLDGMIMRVITSARFEKMYDDHLDRVQSVIIPRLRNKLRILSMETGLKIETMMSRRVKRLSRSTALAAGGIISQSVLYEVNRCECENKFLFMFGISIITLLSYIFSLKNFIGCFDNNEEEYLISKIREVQPEREAMRGMIPCSKITLKQTVISKKRIPEMVSGKLVAKYDEIEETFEDPKGIDVYGTTIPGDKTVPLQCEQNLHGAYAIRIGQFTGGDKTAIRDFIKHSKRLIDKLPNISIAHPTDNENAAHLVSKYGTKRGAVLAELAHEPLTLKDLVCEAFVKKEMYAGKTKDTMKPRMITNRSQKIIAKFSYFFSRLGKELCNIFDKNSDVYYSSGATPQDIGDFVSGRLYNRSHVFESDVSNWDGSLCNETLELEKYFLMTKAGVLPADFELMLKHWTETVMITRGGDLKVELSHGRRSGDLWTSQFNSLINILIVMWVFELDWQSPFSMIVMGDDNGVGLDEYFDVEYAVKKYSDLGMKCEIKKRPEITAFSYCSGMIWESHGGYKWGNLPYKVLGKLGVNYHNHNSKIFKQLLHGTARGMLCTGGHVPILGSILRAIIDTAEDEGIKVKRDNRHLNPYRIQGGDSDYPSAGAYNQFAEIYGVSVDVIFEMEDWIDCNFTILDCPYELRNELFVDGFSKDTGNDYNGVDHHVIGSQTYSQLTYDIPMAEEIEKLGPKGTSFTEVLARAYKFGCEEADLHEDAYDHPFLHMLFSAVSFFNLGLGVSLHGRYNAYALSQSKPACAKKGGGNRPKNPKPKQKKKKKGMDSTTAAYIRMVSDPCHAKLVPGFYGTDEGILTRHKTARSTSATNENGYLLWAPSYGAPKGNFIHFNVTGSDTQITNTVANPLGGGGVTTSSGGTYYPVGGSTFVDSSTVGDFRVIAACMRVTYIGPRDTAQGQIGTIEHLSQKSLIDDLPSVDNLFDYATATARADGESWELVWRPEDGAERFRDSSDTPLTVGTPASSATVSSSEGEFTNPRWMGFALKGVNSVANYTFEFTQVLEWRPAVDAGFSAGSGKQITPPGYYQRVTGWLDSMKPNWTNSIKSAMGTAGSSVMNAGMRVAKIGLGRVAESMFGPVGGAGARLLLGS